MSTYLESLKARIARECEPIDREARFDAVLDENYSFASVGGPFAGLSPSAVLKKCDRVAYQSGVNDLANAECWTEVNGVSYERREVERVREAFASVLEGRVLEIEEAAQEVTDSLERVATDATLAELRSAVREIRHHVF